MATLGKLVVMLEAKGGAEVISTLRGIQSVSNAVNTSISQQNNTYRANQEAVYQTTNAHRGLTGSLVDLIQSYAIFSRIQKQSQDIDKTKKSGFKASWIEENKKLIQSLERQKEAEKNLAKRTPTYGPMAGLRTYNLDKQIEENKPKHGPKWLAIFNSDGSPKDVPGISKFASFIGNAFKAITNNPIFSTLSTAIGMFGKLIQFAAEYYGAVFKFVVPALTAIATKAVTAAAELQSMNLRMQAIQIGQLKQQGMGAGATQKAVQESKDLLNIIKQIAVPSTYLTQDLFQAATEMEAFGINSKRALQPAAMLAEIFGGTNEDLSMVVRQMGRMAAGIMPDARALGKFGINKAQIEQKMTTLPAGTQSPMLEAFIKIITENYGDLFKRLETSFNSKLASLQEQFGFGMEKIGEPILRALMPAMEKLSEFIEQLDASGTLTMFGNALANIVTQLQDPEFLDLLQNTFFDFVGLLHSWMMEITKTVKFFAGLYQFLKETFKVALPGLPGTLGSIFSGKGDTTGFDPEKWVQGLKQTFTNIPNFPGFDIANGMQFGEGYRKNFEKYLSKNPNATGLSKFDQELYKNESLISNIEKTRAATEDQNDKLDKIKDNTKKASDELSLRQAALGGRGGALNQLGMSPTQIAFAGNVNMDRSTFQDPSLMNPVSMLEKAIVEIVRRNDSKTFRRF